MFARAQLGVRQRHLQQVGASLQDSERLAQCVGEVCKFLLVTGNAQRLRTQQAFVLCHGHAADGFEQIKIGRCIRAGAIRDDQHTHYGRPETDGRRRYRMDPFSQAAVILNKWEIFLDNGIERQGIQTICFSHHLTGADREVQP